MKAWVRGYEGLRMRLHDKYEVYDHCPLGQLLQKNKITTRCAEIDREVGFVCF